MLAFLAMVVACSLAAEAILGPALRSMLGSAGSGLGGDVIAELIAVFAATSIMVHSIDRRPWGDLDLSRTSATVQRFAVGLAAGGVPIAAACGVLAAAGLLVVVPWHVDGTWLGAAGRISLVLVPAALAEEMLCRGYLLTVMQRSAGVAGAVGLTSAMFAALHLRNPDATAMSVAVVLLSGIALATVRLATDSLYAAWMAHLAWNWVMAVGFHAAVSGIRFESPGYRAETTGDALISGGGWGPEGGLVAALSIVLALAIFFFLYSRRRRGES